MLLLAIFYIVEEPNVRHQYFYHIANNKLNFLTYWNKIRTIFRHFLYEFFVNECFCMNDSVQERNDDNLSYTHPHNTEREEEREKKREIEREREEERDREREREIEREG
jgi:hypothetical protein